MIPKAAPISFLSVNHKPTLAVLAHNKRARRAMVRHLGLDVRRHPDTQLFPTVVAVRLHLALLLRDVFHIGDVFSAFLRFDEIVSSEDLFQSQVSNNVPAMPHVVPNDGSMAVFARLIAKVEVLILPICGGASVEVLIAPPPTSWRGFLY